MKNMVEEMVKTKDYIEGYQKDLEKLRNDNIKLSL